MSNLSSLLSADKKPALVSDIASFVDSSVARQSGITGMAVRGAVGAAKKIDKNIVKKGINRMLPDIIGELESYWQEFEQSDSRDFGKFLKPRSAEVTTSLLSVADKNSKDISVPALEKAYNALRGKASKIIEPEIPAFGGILQKHM